MNLESLFQFKQSFFGKVALFVAIVLLFTSVILVFQHRFHWLPAIWIAWIWMMVNTYFIHWLLQLTKASDGKNSNKVLFLCLAKYPLLYGIGVVVAFLPFVESEGIGLSFMIYILGFFAVGFGPKIFSLIKPIRSQ